MVRHAARRARRRRGRALGPAAGRVVRRPQPATPTARSSSPRCDPDNVVLMVQPPRGFGENPVAIYHDPDLPPSHHYLAAYRWLDDASPMASAPTPIVHLGKHGNLEWLPGKTLGMSAACGSDAALGNLPLIYPFLVNDPGEGTQAKRRAHATLVDHLIPPMARAESYGDIARLEQLLDEHANIAALDPGKLPAIRQQIWTLMRAAKMDHDLGLDDRPDEDSFDDMLLHVDGWLCEIKDVQIRDGLHILGETPTGERRTGPGAGDSAGAPAVRRRADRAGPAAGARPGRGRPRRPCRGRRRRGARPRTGRGAAGQRAGTRRAVDTTHRRRRRRGDPAVRGHRGGAAAGGHRRRDRPGAARARRRVHRRRARRVRRCAGWSTCCRPGATSTPSIPRRCRRGWPGKPVWRWRIRCWTRYRDRLRRLAAIGRAVGVGYLGDAHLRRRHRRSARAARRPPGVGRRVAAGGRTWRRSRWPSWAVRASTSPCASPASSATRSRTSSRCSTTPCDWSPTSTSPPRTTTCAPTRRPTSPSTATNDAPPQGFSAPSRARTARVCCS